MNQNKTKMECKSTENVHKTARITRHYKNKYLDEMPDNLLYSYGLDVSIIIQ